MRNQKSLSLLILCSVIIYNAYSQRKNYSYGERPNALVISLKNIPREEIPPYPKGDWWKTPLNVLTVTEARLGDLTIVAQNIQRSPAISIYTRDNVPNFVGKAFNSYFNKYNGLISDNADYTFSAELLKFYLVENNIYSGEVHIRYSISNKEGMKLWSGVVKGTTNLFGINFKEVNYNETFSDALQDSFVQLFNQEGFINAWSGKVNTAELNRSNVNIPDLKAELLKLISGGFDETALINYVKQRSISATLVADEMIEWSTAGIPKSVISEVIKINTEAK